MKYFFLFLFFCFHHSYSQINYSLDTVHIVNESLLGEKHAYNSPDSSIYHYKKAYKLCTTLIQKLDDDTSQKQSTVNYFTEWTKKKQGELILNQAYEYENLNDYGNAEEYYENSISTFNTLKNREFIIKSNLAYGNFFENRQDINKALEYYYTSLEISQKFGDKLGEARSYNNIGNIQSSQGNISLAIEFNKKSIELKKELNNKEGLGYSYVNLAVVYMRNDSLKLAKKYFKLGLDIRLELGDSVNIATTYNNIGYLHQNFDVNLDLAKQNYEKALEMRLKINDKKGAATTLSNLGFIYYDNENYTKSISLGNQGLELAKEVDAKKRILWNANLLYLSFEKTNEFHKALEMVKLIRKIEKELNESNNLRYAIIQQAEYTYNKKAFKDSLINKEELDRANLISENQKLSLESKKHQNIFLMIGILMLIIFSVFIVNRYKLTKAQKNELDVKNNLIKNQHLELEMIYNEMKDSIHYAKRLQDAILPSASMLENNFKDYFVLFKPKDVVSGDFFWHERINNNTYLAVADCTGHGVPGAMLSVVCANALNRSLFEFNYITPNEILNKTREVVIDTFSKSGKEIKDGMDISLVCINGDNIIFSGANNPLWIVRETNLLTDDQKSNKNSIIDTDYSLIEIKPDRMPIGIHDNMDSFTNQSMKVYYTDTYYLFTDGYADQFGGEKGKKMKYKPFKKILLKNSELTLNNQKSALNELFEKWRSELEQVDDVCIIGIKPAIDESFNQKSN